ncbi:MAG: hypothetical protein FWF08_04570 [Oscillospiraceae bacterium]|nr:hypothetical protein [Oscillospiraceae bacterium]
MNKTAFKEACDKIVNIDRGQNGIGTLGEKTLHAVLKHYFEPDESKHEIKTGSFFADIANERGIIEIQTRAFDRLRNKLAVFLENCPVTVVYPIPKTKWLFWIDGETGEITKKRKSPKQGAIYDIIPELYKIRQLLINPNFRLCIVFIDMEEYRLLNGWSKDKKKGSTRFDRIPVDVSEEIYINNASEHIKFVPGGLGGQFTSRDFKNAAKINLKTAQTALNILNYLNVVKRVGKQGNLYVYEKI